MADFHLKNMSGRYVSIPFGVPFAEVFSHFLTSQISLDGDALALGKTTVWVPSRRAALALEQALMRQNTKGLVLPAIKPLHLTSEDAQHLAFEASSTLVNHLPPAPEGARLLYLAQQVLFWQKSQQKGGRANIYQAYESATSLAALSDKLQHQDIPFSRLADAVPPDMATHWTRNLAFLKIVFEFYPQWLSENNVADPAALRALLLEEQARQYMKNPPQGPVFLAGFTDTTPPGLALLKALIAAPQGRLVLQGYEPVKYAVPPTHPQYALGQLLKGLGISAKEVVPLMPAPPTAALMSRVHLPPGQTQGWLLPTLAPESAEHLSIIQASTPHQEADAIALLMRQTLEEPKKTCALITTDRGLATRVADRLSHWGLHVNDSAGRPLLMTTAGSFFLLLTQVVVGRFKPPVVAQLLAHPLAQGGQEKTQWKAAVRAFEVTILRGAPPGPGLEGLHAKAQGLLMQDHQISQKTAAQIKQVLEVLTDVSAALRHRGKKSMQAWVAAHITAGKTLSVDADGHGQESFLKQEDGDALFEQLEALLAAQGATVGGMVLQDYHQWLQAFLKRATVREVYAQHPRLFIWGPLEARLQGVDRVVVGGMNEGTWPHISAPDPWLNRSMAKELGLALPEVAIGLNGHDFSALASCSDVFLTRALKVDEAPTVPSRYLLRLQAALSPLEGGWAEAQKRGDVWLKRANLWATYTKNQPLPLKGAQAAPPVKALPQVWSASSVATLMNCPYRLYGQKILKLRPLDPFDPLPDAAHKGELIHLCFEAFVQQVDGLPPPWQGPVTAENLPQAMAHLNAIAKVVFERIQNKASRQVWQSRFRGAARAFVGQCMADYKAARTPWKVEAKGQTTRHGMALYARADRIDQTPSGPVLMDYKTGAVPSKKQVKSGQAPQLSLEGLILQDGGFGNTGGAVAGVEYWKVGGADAPYGRTHAFSGQDLEELMANADEGLKTVADIFYKKHTPLVARPTPQACRLCDYAGLCRHQEWEEKV